MITFEQAVPNARLGSDGDADFAERRRSGTVRTLISKCAATCSAVTTRRPCSRRMVPSNLSMRFTLDRSQDDPDRAECTVKRWSSGRRQSASSLQRTRKHFV
jgi:hypothetical protein